MDDSGDSPSDRDNEMNRPERDATREPVARRRVRGSTKMPALVARHNHQQERLHIDFDQDMKPIGPEEDHFISHLGYLSRSKVRITYDNWRLLPRKMKDMIWQTLLVYKF